MKSIKKNIVFNLIKSICTILFPLVSYSYAARAIGISNIGKVHYSLSIVNYFVLLAALGITTYGIREGAKVRDSKKDIETLVSELFSINILSTIASYFLLFILLACSKKISAYGTIILIQSILIVSTTIGVEWVYNIFEDFKYMAIRSIGVQVVSLLGLILFVKNENDVIVYAWIITISKSGSYLFGMIYARRYVKFRFIVSNTMIKHLKPVFILLGINVAQTIYTNADTTMIGIFNADVNVGLYATAVNIYVGVKSVIYSIINVYSPRIAYENKSVNKQAVTNRRNQLHEMLLIFVLPACIGVFLLSKDIVLLFGGSQSYESYVPLRILSLALVFSAFAGYKSSAFLIVDDMEKSVLLAMCISALLNLVLNFWFIPNYMQNGAAITTLISEFAMWVMNSFSARKIIKKCPDCRFVISIICGLVGIVMSCMVCSVLVCNQMARMIMSIVLSVAVYALILLALRNKMALGLIDNLKRII